MKKRDLPSAPRKWIKSNDQRRVGKTAPRSWSAKNHVLVGLLTLTLLLGGFGGWSVFTELSGAIIAPGKIEVEQNRQVVQHLDGGVVSEILVYDGDEVKLGDVLVRLDDTLLKSDLEVIEARLFELLARRSRLKAERDSLPTLKFDPDLLQMAKTRPIIERHIDGQDSLFKARREAVVNLRKKLEKRRDQTNSRIEGINAQLESIETQIDLIQEELTNQQNLLGKGLTQASRVLALRREEARMVGISGELIAQAAESEGKITEIEIELLRLTTDLREETISELREIEPLVLELNARRNALIERLSRLEITSPANGIVYGTMVFAERSVIRAAEPIMFIVPQDRPLLITAQVPSVHIDEVFPLQPVVLRFPAFDARTTPELDGHITNISADAFSNEATGATFYRVQIQINNGELETLPEERHLVPGMPVETYIRTASYSPIHYLSKPLVDYFNRAFRES